MDLTLQKTKRLPFRSGAFARFLARLLLAGVFGTAATAKMQSMGDFERTLLVSKLVPFDLTHVAAAAVISVEFVVVIALLLPVLQPMLCKVALGLTALLSSTFISYSAWRWIEGISVPCSCFGVLFRLNPPFSILLNLGLLGLTFYVLSDGKFAAATQHTSRKEVSLPST